MVPKTALESAIHASNNFNIKNSSCHISSLHQQSGLLSRPLRAFQIRHSGNAIIILLDQYIFETGTVIFNSSKLNPILGETLQASYNDGTQVFVE